MSKQEQLDGKAQLELDLTLLRNDDHFQVLLRNLYGQAKSCATSPFEKENGLKDFMEIAELDMLMYLKSSKQVEWVGYNR